MRVGLDATPLLGPRTGVGRYVAGLSESLAGRPELHELVLVPFTWRGAGDLPALAPSLPGVRCGRRRVPARLLQAAWARVAFPPVEWLAGPVDLFHATNFAAPPARQAAVVATVHDLSYLRYPEMVTAASARYASLVPKALARGATLCAPTAAVAAELADTYRLAPERVLVTPLGVDPRWAAAAPPDPAWLADRGLPERYLLFVGSQEPRKNLATLLAAYRQLLAGQPPAPEGSGEAVGPADLGGSGGAVGPADPGGSGGAVGPADPGGSGGAVGPADPGGSGGALGAPPVNQGVPPLVLVGPPGWGEALDLAGLPARAVRTPGYLQEDELARVMAGAAALALPSWYEGFGLPALEALACGIPVVAADLPALREVLGDQAELVPPGDADALAATLAKVLEDPGGEPARTARRTRAAAFTWDACAQATLVAYYRALEVAR
jgi:glycosyltransferase involved in cell wall biosynthesis